MPEATYTPIATTTIGSSVNSVTFSNLPATIYRDLILIVSGATSVSENVRLRFNGDTGFNYGYSLMGATSNTPYAGAAGFASISQGALGATGGSSIFQIMDYSVTTKHKSVLTRSNIAGTGLQAASDSWGNTAAINSITVFVASSATFNSNTVLSIYGIAS
jgi:hypothetical protein